MAMICEFGSAPKQKASGYVGVGVVRGTDSEVLGQFFGDVRLVRGAKILGEPATFEFFVMVRSERELETVGMTQKWA